MSSEALALDTPAGHQAAQRSAAAAWFWGFEDGEALQRANVSHAASVLISLPDSLRWPASAFAVAVLRRFQLRSFVPVFRLRMQYTYVSGLRHQSDVHALARIGLPVTLEFTVDAHVMCACCDIATPASDASFWCFCGCNPGRQRNLRTHHPHYWRAGYESCFRGKWRRPHIPSCHPANLRAYHGSGSGARSWKY